MRGEDWARRTTRGSGRRLFVRTRSDSCQTRLDALVALIDGPQIERQRDQVVHLGDRPRIEGQVDRLQVALAGVARLDARGRVLLVLEGDRKSTRLNSSHVEISYAVFCLK